MYYTNSEEVASSTARLRLVLRAHVAHRGAPTAPEQVKCASCLLPIAADYCAEQPRSFSLRSHYRNEKIKIQVTQIWRTLGKMSMDEFSKQAWTTSEKKKQIN